MSEATERLLNVCAWLSEGAAAAWVGLCDSFHAPADERAREAGPVDGPEGPEVEAPARPSFTIAVGNPCRRAYVGPGEVRVGVVPQQVPKHLEPALVRRVEPGSTKMPQRPNPATTRPPDVGAQDFVNAVIDPVLETVGLYCGRARDASGVVDSPFFIYIDGLP